VLAGKYKEIKMANKIIAVAVLVSCFSFGAYAQDDAAQPQQPAVVQNEAPVPADVKPAEPPQEGRVQGWLRKWRERKGENTAPVEKKEDAVAGEKMENQGERLQERGEKREERGERVEEKGERMQEQAQKMEEQAAKQREKGNETAADKLERNAKRKANRGEALENKGERMQGQGERMQKRGEKRERRGERKHKGKGRR